MTGMLFAAFSNLVARSRVDEVGSGAQDQTPADLNLQPDVTMGENPPNPPLPVKVRTKFDELPDATLPLTEKGAGTIEYSKTPGSGLVS